MIPNLIKKSWTDSNIGDGTRTTTDENQDLLLIPSDPESHPKREKQRKRKKKKSRELGMTTITKVNCIPYKSHLSSSQKAVGMFENLVGMREVVLLSQ